MSASLAVVVPVYRNAATLAPLHDRLRAALTGEDWTLRLVVDACPAGSGLAADALARTHPHVHVTRLPANGGQHAAIVAGLRAETAARAWVVMDADLQDPPEAVPLLLAQLRASDADGVFAGRRGVYTSPLRRVTGRLHRGVLHAMTGIPPDAGAFFAVDRRLRTAVLDAWDADGAPSVVAAAGVSGLPLTSIPVTREVRPEGASAWTSRARLRQGLRTVAWALRHRSPAKPQATPRAVPAPAPTLWP